MADDYTPSDGDVRRQYVAKRMHDGATRTHAEQEYTRWLAAQEPTDAEVGAASLALHQALAPDWMGIANVLGANQREYDALLDELALAALSAARAARQDERDRP